MTDIAAETVYDLMRLTAENTRGDAFVNDYVRQNLYRYVRTLRSIPIRRTENARLLDVGGLMSLATCYRELLGYRYITISTRDAESPFVHQHATPVETVYFDAEFDRYPFEDNTFDVVLCLEVVEHLTTDPMRMMAEINRVTKPDGQLIMTTPNVIGWKVLGRLVAGDHPSGWSYYSGYHSDRHNREYTPREMQALLEDAGFDVEELDTFSQSGLQKGHKWLKFCLKPLNRFWNLPPEQYRGDYILVQGRKTSPVRRRLPDWLYGGYAGDRELLKREGHYEGP